MYILYLSILFVKKNSVYKIDFFFFFEIEKLGNFLNFVFQILFFLIYQSDGEGKGKGEQFGNNLVFNREVKLKLCYYVFRWFWLLDVQWFVL